METDIDDRIEAEHLVHELHRLGVRHLTRFCPDQSFEPLPPATLIMALSRQRRSRLRSALILLFLRQPGYAQVVQPAAARLPQTAAMHLKLYYQAAVYLQYELGAELRTYVKNWEPLADLFSEELGLSRSGNTNTDVGLQALGEIHQLLTSRQINWAGSYRQYIPLFFRLLREEAEIVLE